MKLHHSGHAGLARSGAMLFGAWLGMTELMASAQETPLPAAPVKNMYFDWGVVVVMVGIVLFAVCRKSNRT